MKSIALLGPTASGKTSLSIEIAKTIDANILSLDSLSIYKQIDIASAKPNEKERSGIQHFGIDVLNVDDEFNVALFFELFKEAKALSEKEQKNLIIVGGTSFYLKSLMEGLSPKPHINEKVKELVSEKMQYPHKVYTLIEDTDLAYAKNIASSDTYRIEKWLEIYLATNIPPTKYFEQNRRKPLVSDISLFEIVLPRDSLRERITLRTEIMLKEGLLDEVFALEKRFSRAFKPMSSIGIKEALQYYDGYLSLEEMKEKIITNTARLAKRQRTFNKSQFPAHAQGSSDFIRQSILEQF